MIRFIVYYFNLCTGTLWIFGRGLIHLLYRPKLEVMQGVGQAWGTFGLQNAGIKLNIQAQENLNKGPAIFIFNHTSTLDIFIMSALVPYKTLPVAKKSLGYIPILGQFAKAIGVILIDRRNPEKAMRSMQYAKQLADNGFSIALSPEGTRSRTGELLPFKKGAFHLALQTRLPIIPIFIENAHHLQPLQSWLPKPGILNIIVGEPISTADWTLEMLDEKRHEMEALFKKFFLKPIKDIFHQ
ncbi:MAG: 1-acyl-sn-glycerol-3-phosphate acyltransferase [Deltaproteobacteria bacterium]|nr:1-acyl-sn-glycerol-3-phosphate acyltransferase [Deltaproteobacteria bacterium]